jgi:hypothetical protein
LLEINEKFPGIEKPARYSRPGRFKEVGILIIVGVTQLNL